jgi:hypothetical protein
MSPSIVAKSGGQRYAAYVWTDEENSPPSSMEGCKSVGEVPII